MPDQLSKSLRRLLEKYQRAMQATPARMGRADGTLAVPGKTNTIYATELDGPCVEVLNQRVFPEEFGKLVLIGYDPIHFPLRRQVLSCWDAYPEAGNLGVFPHGDSHGIDSTDPVYISSRQYLDGLVVPVAGSLSVQIYPDTYQTENGYKTYAEVTTLDFSASVPTSGARAALLVVDGNGDFVIRNGDLVPNYNLVDNTALPAAEPGDTVRYAIVCYAGQTEAVDASSQRDLVDLRFSAPAKARALPTTTAAGDFLVGDGANWLAKTLAETITILRATLDGIYAAISHNHAGSEITSGTIDGDRLPGLSPTKSGGVPATGTPAGNKFLRDDATWAVPAGSGGGHVIQDDGSPMTSRANLNFVGAIVEDDSINDATVISIVAGGANISVGCKVHNTTDITLPSNTYTVVTFNSNDWDTDNIHSVSTNTDRLVCRTAGKYLLCGNFLLHTSGKLGLVIKVNGTEVDRPAHPSDGDGYTTINFSGVLDLAPDDYVQIFAHPGSVSGELIGSWDNTRTWAVMTLLAPAASADHFYGCRAVHSSTTNITLPGGSTATALPMEEAEYDFGGFFDVANPTRLTIPPGLSGKYSFGGQFYSTADVDFRIIKNGTDLLVFDRKAPGSASVVGYTVTAECALVAGDYIELVARNDSGSTAYAYSEGTIGPAFWISKLQGGSGSASSDAKYLTTASDGTLNAEVVIPGLAGSPDIAGAGGAGTSEEFDTTTDPFTWSVAPSIYNSNTTIKSHYYAKMLTGSAYIHGTKAFVPGAEVAFDARCKLVVGFPDVGTGTKNVRFGVFSSDYASFQGVLMAQDVTYTPHGNVRVVSVDNGAAIVTIEYRPFCLYLRVTRDTSNFYRYFFSDNGILWTQIGISAVARSFEVAKIGFSMVTNTTAGQYVEMACDWLRTDV